MESQSNKVQRTGKHVHGNRGMLDVEPDLYVVPSLSLCYKGFVILQFHWSDITSIL